MKTIYKYSSRALFLMTIVGCCALLITSCEDNDAESGGKPRIDYVRITDPTASDSLLLGSFLGNLVAIVGDNLGNVKQVWFNDQRAEINLAYVKDETILVRVPNAAPKTVTNQVRLVFKNDSELLYDFIVVVPPPALTSMKSEYVGTGDVATLRGNYFFEPLTVTFTGGIVGEVVKVTQNEVQVRVPEGAMPGPVKLKTNFGEAVSVFHFRDGRNVLINSDPYIGWWRSTLVTAGPVPAPISGNYIRVKQTIAEWAWFEIAGGPADAMGERSKRVPDDAMINPQNYAMKFEVNTQKPYNANGLKINIGQDNSNGAYVWRPPYDSKGEWETVTIPFGDIVANTDRSVRPEGYYMRFWFHQPGTLDADISFDNFRVVPIK